MLLSSGRGNARTRTPSRLLLVGDDQETVLLLQRVLASEGFDVLTANTRTRAREAAADVRPDLVLLEQKLGGEETFDLLVELRRVQDFPVILIGGDVSDSDKVIGLRMGADDFVAKPFSYAELVARIHAVIRRSRPRAVPENRVFGRLELDAFAHEVRLDGEIIDLTAKEFELLSFLASAPRQVFTRDQLLEQVWSSSSEWQDPATVTEHVRRVRMKLAQASNHDGWIRTVRGVGYRFDPVAALHASV